MDEEARAARDAKLDEMHERLTRAVEELVTGDDWRRALEFAARFRARSFRNTLLIWSQHQDAFEEGRTTAPVPTYLAGYKQWKALGRSPLPGGYRIFAPVNARFASSTPQDPGSWRQLDRYEKPKPGEAVRSRMVRSKPAYVWDVSMTVGPPIPERPDGGVLTGDAPAGLWEGLAALVEAEGFAVSRVPDAAAIDGADGVTNYGHHTVKVREDQSPAAQAGTLVHELAHVRLHGPDNPDATHHRGIREVEAESVALMVAVAHGMDATKPSTAYVSGWASSVKDKSPVEVVQETGDRVMKLASAILDALPTAQIGGGDPPGLVRDREAPGRAPRQDRSAPETFAASHATPADAAVRSL